MAEDVQRDSVEHAATRGDLIEAKDDLRSDLLNAKDDLRREMKLWLGLGIAGGNVAAAFVTAYLSNSAASKAALHIVTAGLLS